MPLMVRAKNNTFPSFGLNYISMMLYLQNLTADKYHQNVWSDWDVI